MNSEASPPPSTGNSASHNSYIGSPPTGGSGNAINLESRLRLMRDSVINYSGPFVSGLAGLILVPFLLKDLGAETYGLWIAALTVADIFGFMDMGIGFSLSREVAAMTSETFEETAQFVRTAAFAYLGIGILGAVIIAVLALPLRGHLHLSAANQRIEPAIFALAGVGFFAGQILVYALAVLDGLRRFGTANVIAIVGTLLRASGIILLLWMGAGLLPVAMWQAAVLAATAFGSLMIMNRLERGFRMGPGRAKWRSLVRHIPFGVGSLLTSLASNLIWQAAPMLVAFLKGSLWIVPYHIGQKFPAAISNVGYRATGVLFPAASKYERTGDAAGTQQLLEIGTRWIVVLLLPLSLLLWIITPSLLRVWLGHVPPDAVPIMRITIAAVFVDAIGMSAQQVLWGSGAVRRLLLVQGTVAVTNIGLCFWLLKQIGLSGPAWALLLVMGMATIWFLWMAKRACKINLMHLVRIASDGLLVPIAACGILAVGFLYLMRPDRWPGVITTVVLAGLGYSLSLYFGKARQEERAFLRETVTQPLIIARYTGRWLKRVLRRIVFLKSKP